MTNKRNYRKQTWDDWYECAKTYRNEHGDLLIPENYVTPDGFHLGRWIERQRAKHNGVIASSLDAEHEMALEKIGMIWKLEERLDWNVWLSLAKQYHRNYGTLDIPSDHITKDGHRLGFWIKEQRKKRKSGVLRKEQIEELDQLGMRWCFYEKRDWNDWYGLAKKYAQEQGNLWIPFDYTTAEGDKLGVWISVQRERYSGKGNRKPLSSSQIKELDQIGMVWSCSAIRKEKWEAMYRWVKSYCQIHGCLPLRPRIKAPDGRSMGSWISIQRTLLQRGCLEESRVQRLSALGIHPFGQSVPKREIKEAFCYL